MSSAINKQRAGTISIASIGAGKLADINKMVTSIQVSYTMNMASELRFTVIDPDFSMLGKNYFEIGRTVIYTTQTLATVSEYVNANGGPKIVELVDQLFEIARMDVSQGPGQAPQVAITCYSKAIQQMRRDKNPKAIKQDGTAFARAAAKTYGLRFVGEKTSKTKKINAAKGDKQAESLWQVIENLARDSKFIVFETNATMIFASQKYLLNKWGTTSETRLVYDKKLKKPIPKVDKYIPLIYPSVPTVTADGKVINPDFEILSVPSLEYSENDPYDGRGSLQLDRRNATQLRPGMTIDIQGIPQFNGRYLIESVSFDDLSPDPVSISFRKPEKEEKDKKQLSVGKKYAQSNTFTQRDRTQTGPYGLLSSRTKKFIPEYARLLGLTYGRVPTELSTPSKIFPLPVWTNEKSYPKKPATPSGSIVEFGNIDLWSRPVYRDEVGIYPLDAQFAFIYENSASISVILPGIYLDESDHPQRVVDSNEALARYQQDGLHLGKFSNFGLASNYKKLLDIQQVHILANRFSPPIFDIPEYSLHPIPSVSEEQNYPYMGDGLIETGNIDLYSRPLISINLPGWKRKCTTQPFIEWKVVETGYNLDEPFALILERVWNINGRIQLLTAEEAYRKYKQDGLFLAKCSTYLAAQMYVSLLIDQQRMVGISRNPGIELEAVYE